MSGLAMNKIFYLTFILSLAIAGCSPKATPPLEGAAIGGAFTLTNQDNETVSDTDFSGQYRIIYFGYSYCPDVCPIDLQKIMTGYSIFEKQDKKRAANIQPIFITIDPERDTPKVMKQYVAAFHPRLIGLTGSVAAIDATAKKFLILHDKRESEGTAEYLVDHSRQAYLFGPAGEPLALLPYDGTPQEIAAEIDRWAR